MVVVSMGGLLVNIHTGTRMRCFVYQYKRGRRRGFRLKGCLPIAMLVHVCYNTCTSKTETNEKEW